MIKAEIDSIRQLNIEIIYEVKDLEQRIMQQNEALARSEQDLERERRLAKDKAEEVDAILATAGKILTDLTGQQVSLKYG
jgi:FtsZ-binding cell division protein ZapB